MINRICVYCGSNKGAKPEYINAARKLGTTLARNNICLIYGGGKVGMMGEVANSTLAAGGKVIGITPKLFVDMQVIHSGLTELHIVDSMHERKALMAELSDGFISLPGGLGTLEELFEVLTWTQLGIHKKPCGLLNICEYYTEMLKFLENCVKERFLNKKHYEMLIVDTEPQDILERFNDYTPPMISKLLD